jgi:hypothetical protein
VWRGGAARAPIESAPAACAAIEAWLPRAAVRRIAIDPDAPEPALAPDIADLARWLAAAVTAHGPARDRARRAWQAVAALAAVEERSIESMFAELGALDRACSTAAALRAYLAARGITVGPRFHSDPDGAAQWSRALHGWGRGRVAATTAELGALLARRAVADRLAGVDAQDWRAVLHWRSMLPAARAVDLERAALARLPLLAEARRG